MAKSMDIDEFKEKTRDLVSRNSKKEYLCHIKFVVKIGLELAQEVGADADVVEVACLLHDIGREKELANETHEQAGFRIVKDMLTEVDLETEKKEKILDAIAFHNGLDVPELLESQIVRTADGASKVKYHEAFMLLCKKNTVGERLAWGIKYLEKGYSRVSFDSVKTNLQPKYNEIKLTYEDINNQNP